MFLVFSWLDIHFSFEHPFFYVLENSGAYNQFHNILRLFNVLPNFSFTTSETMGDYYL